jgi:sec-independent protein translocase protein TatA
MFETLGAPELLIILVLVVVLFGAGRVGRLGKDLGTSVKEFRRAVKDEDEQPAPTLPFSVHTADTTGAATPTPSAPANDQPGKAIF